MEVCKYSYSYVWPLFCVGQLVCLKDPENELVCSRESEWRTRSPSKVAWVRLHTRGAEALALPDQLMNLRPALLIVTLITMGVVMPVTHACRSSISMSRTLKYPRQTVVIGLVSILRDFFIEHGVRVHCTTPGALVRDSVDACVILLNLIRCAEQIKVGKFWFVGGRVPTGQRLFSRATFAEH